VNITDAGPTHRYFMFIDEAGSPYFDSNKPEKGYIVVATLIPEQDLDAARRLVPRRQNGELIKSSDYDATDEVAAGLIARLLKETRSCIGLVTAALSDSGNEGRMKRMREGIDNSLIPRRSQPSISDAVRMQAALNALALSLSGSLEGISREIRIVFDRGSERPDFKEKVREFMCRERAGAPFVVGDVQWLARHEEPLIMISDWIAGSIRHDFAKADLPLSRDLLRTAKNEGRLHDKIGFTGYLPKA
jgi:Protein of unknown function (DUF3800)